MNNIKLVPTTIIKSEDDLKLRHTKYLEDGYEGTIIRHSNDGYKVNGRSSSLLKYKDFKDIDLAITDITPNDAKPTHGTPHFTLNGKSFKAGVKMSHAEREDLLTNKNQYIGKTANLRFFEYSDDQILRFPVMVGIHEDR